MVQSGAKVFVETVTSTTNNDGTSQIGDEEIQISCLPLKLPPSRRPSESAGPRGEGMVIVECRILDRRRLYIICAYTSRLTYEYRLHRGLGYDWVIISTVFFVESQYPAVPQNTVPPVVIHLAFSSVHFTHTPFRSTSALNLATASRSSSSYTPPAQPRREQPRNEHGGSLSSATTTIHRIHRINRRSRQWWQWWQWWPRWPRWIRIRK